MRLIEWNGPVVDPGSSSTQDPTSWEEVHIHRAVFDEPVPIEFVYSQRQCPKFFETYNFNGRINNFLFVVGRECKQMPDVPQVYEVNIKYANKWTNEQNADRPQVQFQFIANPLLRPALYTLDSYTHREAIEIDFDGKPVVTTAGEPLILEEEIHCRKITITKNVPAISPALVKAVDYMNIDDVLMYGTTWKKGTLWLWPIQVGHISSENGYLYFPIVMTMLYNAKGWNRRIRNAGYYQKSFVPKWAGVGSGAGRTKYYPTIPIRFSTGEKADRPILLDKQGWPIQKIETGKAPDPGNPGSFYKTYDVQTPDDFARAFTPAELEEATLKFRTKEWLEFAKTLPLS